MLKALCQVNIDGASLSRPSLQRLCTKRTTVWKLELFFWSKQGKARCETYIEYECSSTCSLFCSSRRLSNFCSFISDLISPVSMFRHLIDKELLSVLVHSKCTSSTKSFRSICGATFSKNVALVICVTNILLTFKSLSASDSIPCLR
jgi:hypothetical protein